MAGSASLLICSSSGRAPPTEGNGRKVRSVSLSGEDSVAFLLRRGKNPVVNSLLYLAGANLVIWVGLFLYLWRLDRRIVRREQSQ